MKSIPILVFALIVAITFSAGVSARDVHQGDTIYIGETDLNLIPALPDEIVGLCIWDTSKDEWMKQSCSAVRKNAGVNILADWDYDPENTWKLIPGDYYAITQYHREQHGNNTDGTPRYFKTVPEVPEDTRQNLILVFKVKSASEMPTPSPSPTLTPTPSPTPDYEKKIEAMETRLKEMEKKTALPTATPTVVKIIPAPVPTATVNHSATIAALEKQIAEQNVKIEEQGNWIDKILKFLGMK